MAGKGIRAKAIDFGALGMREHYTDPGESADVKGTVEGIRFRWVAPKKQTKWINHGFVPVDASRLHLIQNPEVYDKNAAGVVRNGNLLLYVCTETNYQEMAQSLRKRAQDEDPRKQAEKKRAKLKEAMRGDARAESVGSESEATVVDNGSGVEELQASMNSEAVVARHEALNDEGGSKTAESFLT